MSHINKLFDEIKLFFPGFQITLKDLSAPTAQFLREFLCYTIRELGVDLDNVLRVMISFTNHIKC